MDTITHARIDDYLDVFDRVNPVVKNSEVTAMIIEQIGKDTRCEWLMANKILNKNSNSDEPATEKQLGFLKRLKVEVSENCSKQKASRLIDEAQAKAA